MKYQQLYMDKDTTLINSTNNSNDLLKCFPFCTLYGLRARLYKKISFPSSNWRHHGCLWRERFGQLYFNTLGKTIKSNFYTFTHSYGLNLNVITILSLQIHSYNHTVDSYSVFRESCFIPVHFWHTNVQATNVLLV